MDDAVCDEVIFFEYSHLFANEKCKKANYRLFCNDTPLKSEAIIKFQKYVQEVTLYSTFKLYIKFDI